MNEVTVVVVEEATPNTIMAITPEELELIKADREKKARQVRIEGYRNEMADLLERMKADNVSLRSFSGTKTYYYCSRLCAEQVPDAISII